MEIINKEVISPLSNDPGGGGPCFWVTRPCNIECSCVFDMSWCPLCGIDFSVCPVQCICGINLR